MTGISRVKSSIGDKSVTSLIRHWGDSPSIVGKKIDTILQSTLDAHDCR